MHLVGKFPAAVGILFLAAVGAWGHCSYATPISEVAAHIRQSLVGNRAVLLGEAQHHFPKTWELLEEVLREDVAGLSYLALESSSDDQAALDAFLGDPAADAAALVSQLWSDSELDEAGAPDKIAAVLSTIRELNKKRAKTGVQPLAILLVDKPQPANPPTDPEEELKAFGQWMASRDAYMFGVIQSKTQFQGKGIVFCGAAHLTKDAVAYPSELALMLKTTAPYDSLGTLLRQELKQTKHYFIQEALPPQFAYVRNDRTPASIQGVFALVDKVGVEAGGTTYLKPTGAADFTANAYGIALPPSEMNYLEKFDFVVWLGS